jgi:hypothetical protein
MCLRLQISPRPGGGDQVDDFGAQDTNASYGAGLKAPVLHSIVG